MEIFIYSLSGEPLVVNLDDVGACYPSDDTIYFCGIPCRLSSATPNQAMQPTLTAAKIGKPRRGGRGG